MSNIGRNDYCSCGSMKKYKKCCMNNKLVEELKLAGITYYDGKLFLKEVMKNNCFKNFYEDNKDSIQQDLILGVHNQLGASMSYGIFPTDNNSFNWMVINDKISPVQEYKAIEVAHELQHIINHLEGYPSVCFKIDYEENDNVPCKNISDMLNDPLVNGRIMKYDFDMKAYFDKADKIQIPAIETYNGHIKNTFIITLCVKRYLDYKNLYPDIKKEDIYFIKWCRENYSELVKYSDLIISWIEEIGYETKESAEIILMNAIKLLGYENYMDIKYF